MRVKTKFLPLTSIGRMDVSKTRQTEPSQLHEVRLCHPHFAHGPHWTKMVHELPGREAPVRERPVCLEGSAREGLVREELTNTDLGGAFAHVGNVGRNQTTGRTCTMFMVRTPSEFVVAWSELASA